MDLGEYLSRAIVARLNENQQYGEKIRTYQLRDKLTLEIFDTCFQINTDSDKLEILISPDLGELTEDRIEEYKSRIRAAEYELKTSDRFRFLRQRMKKYGSVFQNFRTYEEPDNSRKQGKFELSYRVRADLNSSNKEKILNAVMNKVIKPFIFYIGELDSK